MHNNQKMCENSVLYPIFGKAPNACKTVSIAFCSNNCNSSIYHPNNDLTKENKIFQVFSADAFPSQYTHYKIIKKYKKNSVLHAFLARNVKLCEKKVFDGYFALFRNTCKIFILCKIIRKVRKHSFVGDSWKMPRMHAQHYL